MVIDFIKSKLEKRANTKLTCQPKLIRFTSQKVYISIKKCILYLYNTQYTKIYIFCRLLMGAAKNTSISKK